MELKHVNKQPLSTERTESRHQTDSPGTGLTPSREERNAGRGSDTRRLGVSKEASGASIKWQEMLPAAQQCGFIVQELCESRGGRPGLSVLTNLLVSVDVKNY